MIDGAKGPTFGVASLRSVSAAVSPDERSEESPKAMSIRGASSNSASSGKRTGAISPLVAGYWLLVVGTLRPQAASKSARKELTWDDEKLLGLMLAA